MLFQFQFVLPERPYSDSELVLFALLAVLGGALGNVMVRVHGAIVRFRRRYQAQILGSNPYIISAVVVIAFSAITFWLGNFARRPYRENMNDLLNGMSLFHSSTENSSFHAKDWANGPLGLWTNLFVFFCTLLLSTCVSITLPLPCGVFAPIFCVGMLLGRAVGEALLLHSSSVVPAVYAVVGGVSIASGVSQTLSAAVIVLEITGQLKLLLPSLMAATLGCVVSYFILPGSIYADISKMKNIPVLSRVGHFPVLPRIIVDSFIEYFEMMFNRSRIHVLDVFIYSHRPRRKQSHRKSLETGPGVSSALELALSNRDYL